MVEGLMSVIGVGRRAAAGCRVGRLRALWPITAHHPSRTITFTHRSPTTAPPHRPPINPHHLLFDTL
eukprot:scaffold42691_cov78-Cyclotella_meneghiniana.AAC.17